MALQKAKNSPQLKTFTQFKLMPQPSHLEHPT